MSFETTEIALLNTGDRFGCQTQYASDNFTRLPGAEEGTRYQHFRAELAREAQPEFMRLPASRVSQRNVIGIGETSLQIRLGLAMTNQDDPPPVLLPHASMYIPLFDLVLA